MTAVFRVRYLKAGVDDDLDVNAVVVATAGGHRSAATGCLPNA